MTSRKSFQNNAGFTYRSGLREGSFLAVLLAAVTSFFVYMDPVSIFFSKQYDPETGMPIAIDFTKEYSYLFLSQGPIQSLVLIASFLIAGVVMAVLMFRFITNKKTVNVYYSLGITRAKLFTSKYLAGLTLLFAAAALPLIVMLIINISIIGANRFMISAFFYILLGTFSIAAFSYSVTSAVISCVGTMFEGALFSAVVIMFPEIFLRSLQVFIQKFVFGSPLGRIFTEAYFTYNVVETEELVNKFSRFNPFRYMQSGFVTYSYALPKGKLQAPGADEAATIADWTSPDLLVPIIWILVAAAVFALGCYLFRRRKAEIAGFIGSNKPLNFVMSFVVSTAVFALAFNVASQEALSNALSILIGAAAFIIVYCIINLILLRDIRIFVKELRGLPIQVSLLAVLLVFFGTGYFGAANRIPKTEDIASAKITIPYMLEYTDSDRYGYQSWSSSLFWSSAVPRGNYTTENDINFVRGIHESIVKTGRVKPSLLDDSFNGIYATPIQISYKLKNGKEIKRYYFGASKDILDALTSIDNTDYRKATLKKIFKDPVNDPTKNLPANEDLDQFTEYRDFLYINNIRSEESSVNIYPKTLSTEIGLELNSEQRAKLIDCLYSDLLELSPDNHYNPNETLGVISFYAERPENPNRYGSVSSEYYEEESDQTFDGRPLTSDSSVFVITPEMKRTVELIKSLGYYDDMTAEKEIEKVNIIQVKDTIWPYETAERGGNSNIESQVISIKDKSRKTYFDIDDKNKIKTVTDEKAIKELYPEIVSRGKVLPNDYLVEIVFTDGFHSLALVHENKMPESVLKSLK